jgi:hypothetical protein
LRHRKDLEHALYGGKSVGLEEAQAHGGSHDLSDERCMIKRLRQLGLKQFDIQTRFAELERERRLLHEQVRNEFHRRVDQLREDRIEVVGRFLTTMEGGEYFRNTKDSKYPGCTLDEAKARITEELVHDAKKSNQRAAAEELEPQFLQAERDFHTKCRVLVDALTDIEDRAAPNVKTLLAQPEGGLLLRTTGFVLGLAAQARAWMAGGTPKEKVDGSDGVRNGDAAAVATAAVAAAEKDAATAAETLQETRGANGDYAAGAGTNVTVADPRLHRRPQPHMVIPSHIVSNKTTPEYSNRSLQQRETGGNAATRLSEDQVQRNCGQQ